MVWVGFKFGLGFWLATIALAALVTLLVHISSWVFQFWKTRKRSLRRKERAPKGVEWKRTSTSAPRDDSTIQSFLFCSVIRWEDREHRTKRQHRDGVR